jgi:hypothetical protein
LKRYTGDELYSRLIFIIGFVLVVIFGFSVMAMLYALVFVTQPMNQAPNDRDFIEIIKTLTLFLTGALSGFLSGYGIKSKKDDDPKEQVPISEPKTEMVTPKTEPITQNPITAKTEAKSDFDVI